MNSYFKYLNKSLLRYCASATEPTTCVFIEQNIESHVCVCNICLFFFFLLSSKLKLYSLHCTWHYRQQFEAKHGLVHIIHINIVNQIPRLACNFDVPLLCDDWCTSHETCDSTRSLYSRMCIVRPVNRILRKCVRVTYTVWCVRALGFWLCHLT